MYRQFADAVGVPVLANITEFGQTPLFTVDELAQRRRRDRALPAVRVPRDEPGGARTSTRRCAATARRRTSSTRCRRATSCTSSSAITPTSRSSTQLFARQQDLTMSSRRRPPTTPAVGTKPKKSVALSGVTAGNTALCTVGRTGNDLHYRGYDILDIAATLRVRGDRLPAGPRQAADARRARRLQGASSKSLRGIPGAGARGARAAFRRPRIRWT